MRFAPRHAVLLPLLALPFGVACEENYYSTTIVTNEEGGSGGDGGAPGAGAVPVADTALADLPLDLFGTIGNRFWFEVSEEQLELINGTTDGGWIGEADIYTPGGGATYADHLWVTTAGDAPQTSDLGQVEVKLAGQSTRRSWTRSTLPSLNLDTDEFVDKQKLSGYEHLRFANALVGTIFRERFTLEVFNRLDYPAPLTNYVWLSSNVWGADVSIPYILVERYKPHFCERWHEQLGGGCPNMWEFVGDFNGGAGGGPMPLRDAADIALPPEPVGPSVFDLPDSCQFSSCDSTRVRQLEAVLLITPQGPGFAEALAEYVDWHRFHRFQCLSWILSIGDDALHGGNNTVIVERGDGRFQYLPYSVDISLGQDWYASVPLVGTSVLATGCQSDPDCWAATISSCEAEIRAFTKLDPPALLDEIHDDLEAAGMLRSGDEARYTGLRNWLVQRVASLPDELEANRELPTGCTDGMVDCGGGVCDYPENCGFIPLCAPVDAPVEGVPACDAFDAYAL